MFKILKVLAFIMVALAAFALSPKAKAYTVNMDTNPPQAVTAGTQPTYCQTDDSAGNGVWGVNGTILVHTYDENNNDLGFASSYTIQIEARNKNDKTPSGGIGQNYDPYAGTGGRYSKVQVSVDNNNRRECTLFNGQKAYPVVIDSGYSNLGPQQFQYFGTDKLSLDCWFDPSGAQNEFIFTGIGINQPGWEAGAEWSVENGSSVLVQNGSTGPDLNDHSFNLTLKAKKKPLKPSGNLSANCPTVSGNATDPAQPNARIYVDLYYDSRDDSKLVNTVAYNRVQTNTDGTFSTGIPDVYKDDRTHSVHAYALGKNQNIELSGSPASFRCPASPQFHPWLQTKNGDVTATGSITGQDFFKPGSRNNYSYAEAAIYTANGAAGTQAFTAAGPNTGPNTIVPRGGSLNPPGSKFSRVLTDNGSQAVVEDYTGVLSGVSAYVGGENYFDPDHKNDNPAPHYKLLVTNKTTGKTVASTEGYAGTFQYANARVTDNMADASKAITGSFRITVTFDNDAHGDLASNPVADRNLLVDQIRVYGNSVSGPEATYARVSQKVNGSNPSNFFCSLNFYYLSALVDNGDFSCNPAGSLSYVFGENINNSFSQISTAINQAWSNALSNPGSFCTNTSLPLNCDPSMSEIIQLNGDQTINGLTIPPGRHTIWVKGGSLRIAGNIVPAVANNLPPQQQPVLGIIVDGGDVGVAPGVTQLNAMVYTAGKFNTCAGYPLPACSNQLTVNGQIITANGYTFGRNYFDRYTSNQNPAELFVLNPLGVSFAPPGFDKNSWSLDSQLNYTSSEPQPRLR